MHTTLLSQFNFLRDARWYLQCFLTKVWDRWTARIQRTRRGYKQFANPVRFKQGASSFSEQSIHAIGKAPIQNPSTLLTGKVTSINGLVAASNTELGLQRNGFAAHRIWITG